MNRSIYKRIQPKPNTIYRGDNLEILRAMPDKCVNLIYIDPPFFTQKNYKNIWGDKESVQDYGADFFNGFEDTRDFFERHINSDAKGLKAFLEWIRARFVECERILKDSGSFYLHLDYHTVHYAKVMLDEIFGYKNFRNEIIWRRKKGSNATKKARRFSTNSDTILFYTKSKQYLFDLPYLPHDEEYVKKTYKFDDNDGRGLYRLGDLSAPSYSPTLIYDYKEYKPPRKGWRYNQSKMKQMDEEGRLKFPTKETGRIQQKRYLSEMKGNPVENIWFDIGALQDKSPEKTGWPTQKPVALLERIISSSSKEGDIVFDCFAGCGTAMHAAHNLKRKWIGIDISPTAIRVNQERLEELGAKVNVVDENDLPVNLVEQKRRKSLKEAA